MTDTEKRLAALRFPDMILQSLIQSRWKIEKCAFAVYFCSRCKLYAG